MKNKQICLLSATAYSGNMGVNALTYSALLYFEKVAEKLGEKYKYILVGTGGNQKKNDFITIGNRNIYFQFFPMRYVCLKPNIKRFGRSIKETIGKSDIIVDLGEGDSFSDIYGFERFWNITFPKIVSLFLKKKIALLPQTIGPFNRKYSRVIANFVLKRIKEVYPRDQLSHKYLTDYFPGKQFNEFLDMAFFLPFQQHNFNNTDKIHVGINVSALLWHGGYNRSNMFNLLGDYKELIKQILIKMSNKKKTIIHLIPHVITDNYPIEDDYSISKNIQEMYPDIIVAPKFKTPVDAKSYISGMDFFIGSRMHSCIAAFSTGVPVLPISYSRKFNGLFQNSLSYKHLADPTVENNGQIIDKIMESFKNRHQLLKEIQSKNELIKNNHINFINQLAWFIKS